MYIFKSRYQQVILPESICPNCTHFLSSRTFLSTSCWNKLNKFTRDTFPGHWICFSVETMTSFYDLKAKKLTGEVVSMEEYKGKVVLVENTASLWGTTIRDFTQMNELCEKVKKKSRVSNSITWKKHIKVLSVIWYLSALIDPTSNTRRRKGNQLYFSLTIPYRADKTLHFSTLISLLCWPSQQTRSVHL